MLPRLGKEVGMANAKSLLLSVKQYGEPPKRLANIVDGYEVLAASSKPAPDPANEILDAAAEGILTVKKAHALAAPHVNGKAVAEYLTRLLRREDDVDSRQFIIKFHEVLRDGGADDILNLLRPSFDDAAEDLHSSLQRVDITAPDATLVARGTTEQLEALRSLPALVGKIASIASIASRFGVSGVFPLIEDPREKDMMLRAGYFAGLDDRAIWCTGGDLIRDSRMFRLPNPATDIRNSPWLRLQPKLWTTDEARERVRDYASRAWIEMDSSRPKTGRLVDGVEVWDKYRNPFALPEGAEV